MHFQLLNGGLIEAVTDQQLIEALRQDGMAWTPSVGIEDFMDGMAERAALQKGFPVSTSSVSEFLGDLQLYGFLIPQFDPWIMVSIDSIKFGLFGPGRLSNWDHKLLWSSTRPIIVSTLLIDGRAQLQLGHPSYSIRRAIELENLPKNDYQQVWLQEHLRDMRRFKIYR